MTTGLCSPGPATGLKSWRTLQQVVLKMVIFTLSIGYGVKTLSASLPALVDTLFNGK